MMLPPPRALITLRPPRSPPIHPTQCFLLTPKLLPDLEYGRNVTVLQILNGAIGAAGGGEGGAAAQAWDVASLLGSQAVSARG
jgi:hypothetical protein